MRLMLITSSVILKYIHKEGKALNADHIISDPQIYS